MRTKNIARTKLQSNEMLLITTTTTTTTAIIIIIIIFTFLSHDKVLRVSLVQKEYT